jgi:signal transduction histidine kinase
VATKGWQQEHVFSKGARGVTYKERQLSGEWTVCLMRWGLLALLLLVALLDSIEGLSVLRLAPFLVAVGIYNLAVTALLTWRLYFPALPVLTLVADTLTIVALLHLSGGASSLFFVLALFPISIASLRFGWHVGLLTAGVFVLNDVFQTAIVWETGQDSILLLRLGQGVVLYLVGAVVTGVGRERVPLAEISDPSAGAEQHIVPEHLKMVYEMASSLSATLNYERILDAILDISRFGFAELGLRVGESVGVVLLYNKEGWLTPVSYRHLVTREDETRRIRGRSGILEEAISSTQAVIGEAAGNDPELREFDSLRRCKSILCVPLRAGFETYGAILFASVRRRAYTVEHAELLSLFCNQATIALQNAGLYQSLQEERDKIVYKEEEARHKLARELHDGPTQDVAAIAMRLNFARLLLDRDPRRAREELERIEDLAHRTVREIRSMLFALRPIVLTSEGLVAALQQQARNIRENDGLPVAINTDQYRDCLELEVQGAVFNILAEALNNARKHAEASRVWVRLAAEDNHFLAEVIDNGRGFDVDSVEESYETLGSMGLLNLKEQAERLGGTLKIESVPGRGTRVTLLIPLSEEVV